MAEITGALTPPPWTEDARCARSDPDAWHADIGTAEEAFAKAVCRNCPVLDECARWVMATEKPRDRWGIFGGMSAPERSYLDRHPELDYREVWGRPQLPATVETVADLIERGMGFADVVAETMLCRATVSKLMVPARSLLDRRARAAA